MSSEPFLPVGDKEHWDMLKLSHVAFKLMHHLWHYAHGSATAWLGRERMAKELNVSEKTVTRAINELIERKYIVRQYRPGQTSLIRFLKPWYIKVPQVYRNRTRS